MAKGNEIIVSAAPRGIFYEGTITGALKPGIVVQIDVSEGIDANGNFTWEAYDAAADGDRRLIAVLLPDNLRGKLATEAYASGDHGFVYVPLPGDQLNMLLQDVAGTADTHAFGELLKVDDGTGKLIATVGTTESEPFQLLETLAAPTADVLAHCIFTGY